MRSSGVSIAASKILLFLLVLISVGGASVFASFRFGFGASAQGITTISVPSTRPLSVIGIGISQSNNIQDNIGSLSSRRQRATEEMLRIMNVRLTGKDIKRFPPSRDLSSGKEIDAIFSYENLSKKEIVGVMGTLGVIDRDDEVFFQFYIFNDKPIKAGQTVVRRDLLFIYDSFRDDQLGKLDRVSIDKLKFQWKPKVLAFADGTTLYCP